jgi:hypothetical protein
MDKNNNTKSVPVNYSISSSSGSSNKITASKESFQDNPGSTQTQSDLASMLDSYNPADKAIIKAKLAELELANKLALKKILPTGSIPIYLSPLDPETQVLESATWNQYSEVGPYAEFSDGYCRPEEGGNVGNWVYPRRNPGTQAIELASCDKLITDDVKEIAKLANYVPGMLEVSAVKLLMLDAGSTVDTKRLRSTTESLTLEYEQLQDQYIQLTNLLDTNMDLIKGRRNLITKGEQELDTKENDYNIKRELITDDITGAKEWDKKLTSYHFYLKLGASVLILITIFLVLLIDIGRVL